MSRPTVFDTNAMLTILLSHASSQFVSSHPRTKHVSRRAVDELRKLFESVDVRLSLPVLVEVDYFLTKPTWMRRKVVASMQVLSRTFPVVDAEVAEVLAVDDYLVAELGVVDVSLIAAADYGVVVVTDDARLASEIAKRGGPVLPTPDPS